ncbi:MFS transporter, partial [Clostridioides difficile]|nr:MFS transporter [Clostridioides difficile]
MARDLRREHRPRAGVLRSADLRLFRDRHRPAGLPHAHAATSLLLSVGTFGISFITRPLGSIVLGSYADRAGRKASLTISIGLMMLGTAMIAFAPTYAQIGALAPALLLVARLFQGLSVGGEYGTS